MAWLGLVAGIVSTRCPHCSHKVLVLSQTIEPHLCPECLHFFPPAKAHEVPGWVWGVVAALFGNFLLLV